MSIQVNEAQAILIACGAEPQLVLLGHVQERSRSHTKKGPGRRHRQKHSAPGTKMARLAADERLCVRNPGGMVSVAFNEIRRQRNG